jgi:HlyD family type I secretion membrane fusion protein
VLGQRVAQLREDIVGSRARRAAYRQQLASIVGERESLAYLLARELITRARILQLDRTESGIRGQIAEADAAIARAGAAIAEYTGQIAQLRKDRAAEVSASLGETRARLLDVAPRLQRASTALDRATVRAPYAGTVVDLDVFSVGGVVGRGERILDIVPEGTSLVVEAKVAVHDIADVRPGMAAEVHFTSYKQRAVPPIHGIVSEVSADRLTDERTGFAYYTALITVDPRDLAATPDIRLYPGMPATVMVTTEERTAFDYLVGPLAASFDRAFRER